MPTNKKINIIILSLMLSLALIFSMTAYIQIKKHKTELTKQENAVYFMAGSSDAGINSTQVAGDILKGQLHADLIQRGHSLLEQYGYKEHYQTQYDRQYHYYLIRTILFYLALYLIFLIGYTLLLHFLRKIRTLELEEVELSLADFYNGNYDRSISMEGDDIKYRIHYQLELLGNHLKLKDEQLQNEKEITKSIVTDISHQLKTPVSSLKMCYSLLIDEKLTPDERQEFIYRLRDQLDHLELLTEALISISRMETGMIMIKMEPQDILETITQAINQVYLKAEAKNISIQLEGSENQEPEPLLLPHDMKWTSEAIANVLDNGIKYSPANSKIIIRIMKLVNFLRIEIEDEGIGIAEEEYHKIFKRFYRGRSEHVSKIEGTGVGLYLSRNILEEQGGSITVMTKHGRTPSTGSIFVLQLQL